ncbi:MULTISPECIES: tRNA dihydrouridine(20/20a) synthase DusA [Inquilinus]|uniref:tRNA-dihydrouridine(20/20a) synthase n=1 Tax=Inquilinus ginsengisoli TaxID=363840 RepID=A0ABU1K170_9PROT|nr:tRNA dihydrouridine(20/20a) synthase DusA [Inquilinus ginsengisoli]MDR6294622.1 tRNA-dihydrouridine synthase A [Inquilinus ginsengisoli]
MPRNPTHRLSVAPMMDWTDRHCRFFLRLISRHALLYTEMVTTGAVLHGDRDRILGFSGPEHPVALQLGGSDPEAMAKSAAIGAERGYDEININVGCPSDRVQSGRFGACLMAEPATVAACVSAMRAACDVPVTVKSRIGIDDRDSYELLAEFIGTIAAAGCDTFTVHARKAWLSGLSPKENREIPPLRYDVVHRLKRDFPHLTIAINGGITSLDAAEAQLALVDGVMIGREAYQNPWMLAEADRRIFGDSDAPVRSRQEIVEAFLPYVEAMRSQGAPLGAMTRHLLGLYQAVPGARAFRRHIAENAHRAGAGPEVLRTAVDLVESAIEQRRAA